MRKLFALLLILSVAVFTVTTVNAQEETSTTEQMTQAVDSAATAVEETPDDAMAAVEAATTVS